MSLTGNLRGILWMCASAMVFSGMLAIARALSEDLSLMQIVFLRSAGGLAVMLPWAARAGRARLMPTAPGLMLLRSAILFLGVSFFYYSVYHIPISDAVAIQFTAPLFTALMAVAVLGERPDLHRWGATVVGMIGALIIVRPGFQQVPFAVIAVVLSALFYAGDSILLRILGRSEPAPRVVFYMSLMMAPMALAPALFDWRPITWDMAPDIALLGAFAAAAHFTLARAYAWGEASVVSPFSFLRLPVAAAAGYALFGQTSDGWTWAGAVVIFVATSHITRREARASGRDAAH